jgi:tRNA-2-methylthio-N6-dimethylallyladenosine synthase
MAAADIIGKVLPVTIDSLERYSLLGALASPTARTSSSTLSPMTDSSQMTQGA